VTVTGTGAVPLMRADGLAKRFGRVTTANSVSFHVGAGEVLGVVGPNGAGKSTLLDLVNGGQRPDAGSIFLDGHDVTSLDAAARGRRGIARTHQIPRPFGGLTVFENVLVGASFAGQTRRRAAYERAHEAIDTAGLGRVENVQAGSLRLLDRKRLELARALATSPRLLLLDEIAGGLTDRELPELIDVIARLRDAGMAIIWIEHIVHALLQVVDRLMCLAMGDVVATGDPRSVMRSPEVTEVYLGSIPEPEGGAE
jgi:branched-chain amino acid transport system ATP-binding protein